MSWNAVKFPNSVEKNKESSNLQYGINRPYPSENIVMKSSQKSAFCVFIGAITLTILVIIRHLQPVYIGIYNFGEKVSVHIPMY